MNSKVFVNWLIEERGLKENVAISRAANCYTIEKAYGNLDGHFMLDKCGYVFEELKYTKKDQRENLPARHKIIIGGDVYNNTATYRQALNRYVDFMKAATKDNE